MKLLSNGFEYKVISDKVALYYGEQPHPFAKKVTKAKYVSILESVLIDGSISFKETSEFFYFAFVPLEGLNNELTIDIGRNKSLKKEFVKWKLYNVLKNHFIIDFTKYGSDLSLYKKNPSSQWQNWDSFSSYNLIIRGWEIHISVGSRNTLISKATVQNFTVKGFPAYKALVDGHIQHKETLEQNVDYHVLASQEIRINEQLISRPVLPNYSNYFKDISTTYQTLISYEYEGLVLLKDGFKELMSGRDYFPVARDYNVMKFKDGHTNINAANGMKMAGPFKGPSIDLKNLEFIFIYPNKEKVTELFYCFRNGKTAYYPGLERYVDIPIRQPSKEIVLKYDYNNFENLPELVNNHIQSVKEQMPNKIFFAIVLLPKSKKDSSEGDVEYYELKKVLIENEVPSQFIDEREIGTNNFVYWLPNISIAIQAKLGGVPWKLNRQEDKELIVGFGDATESDQRFIGSTVFFDNSGKLKANNFFQRDNLVAFKQSLKESILNYIQENAQRPERLIIHYYKIPGAKEKDAVLYALKDIGLDIPYVIVTINDTKAKDFIAFDESYGNGMPMSGLAWRISQEEFILFNNTRYEEWPRSGKPAKQEYPIKLKIWFSNIHHRSEPNIQKVIGQVFEFSRMYWKSIHQQSKPVTATYPEMIAKYGSQFPDYSIPKNQLTQNTPWFI